MLINDDHKLDVVIGQFQFVLLEGSQHLNA